MPVPQDSPAKKILAEAIEAGALVFCQTYAWGRGPVYRGRERSLRWQDVTTISGPAHIVRPGFTMAVVHFSEWTASLSYACESRRLLFLPIGHSVPTRVLCDI